MGDTSGGYGAVLAERPIRDLLLASLCGRFAFNALGLGFVLFAAAETDSIAITGALIAAFAITTAPAPARGRLVDRHGPGTLALLALGSAGAVALLVVAGAADAPAWTFVLLAGVAGLSAPRWGRSRGRCGVGCRTTASSSSRCTRWTPPARSRR